jgi:hypothetical protein
MIAFDASNSHFEYMDVLRHWSPTCEKYTGGDALLTFLLSGWNLIDAVFYEEHWHSGVRMVVIYHFQLERDGEKLSMPVFSNPYVSRLVQNIPLPVVPIKEREKFYQRQPVTRMN